jgi:hypothetical protein
MMCNHSISDQDVAMIADDMCSLREENSRLRAALKVARQWMPFHPLEDEAKAEVALVDAALGESAKEK